MTHEATMKPIFSAAVATLISLLSVAPSWAQAVWTSPYGAFTLLIPEGWKMVPLPETTLGSASNIDLVIGAVTTSNPPVKSGCTVAHMIRPTPGKVTQAGVNLALAAWNQEFVTAELSKRGTPITDVLEFTNGMKTNIRVVSMHYLVGSNASNTEFWQSQFLLALEEKDAAFFTVTCLTPQAENDPNSHRALNAINSLRFHE